MTTYEDVITAVEDLQSQIVKAQEILTSWPHAQCDKAVFETEEFEMRFVRPRIVIIYKEDGYESKLDEMPAYLRLKYAAYIPEFMVKCAAAKKDFVTDVNAVVELLENFLKDK